MESAEDNVNEVEIVEGNGSKSMDQEDQLHVNLNTLVEGTNKGLAES